MLYSGAKDAQGPVCFYLYIVKTISVSLAGKTKQIPSPYFTKWTSKIFLKNISSQQ